MSHGMSDQAALPLSGDGFRRWMRRVLGQPAALPVVDAGSGTPVLRRSSGLREFWKAIEAPSGLRILDLGSASQANVNFITGLHHKLYTEDLVRALLLSAPGSKEAEQAQREVEEFFRENLNYPEGEFDGILCWDLFDFLADPLVKPLVERLQSFLKPGGTVLSFFHTATPGQEVALFQYLIRGEDSLQLIGRGSGKVIRHFNNRSIENLFRSFASIKFYLARDNLREVISVR